MEDSWKKYSSLPCSSMLINTGFLSNLWKMEDKFGKNGFNANLGENSSPISCHYRALLP